MKLKQGDTFILNSPILFDIACSSYRRCKRVRDASTGAPPEDDQDAIVAIMFAAASVEAFIHEATLSAAMLPSLHGMAKVATLMEEAEDAKMEIRRKVRLLKAMLGEPFALGEDPYQSFNLLITLRNNIVHMKPDKIGENLPHFLSEMRSRKLCLPAREPQRDGWLKEIATMEAAQWACNTAADIVQSFCGGDVPTILGTVTRTSFDFARV